MVHAYLNTCGPALQGCRDELVQVFQQLDATNLLQRLKGNRNWTPKSPPYGPLGSLHRFVYPEAS